MKKLVIKNILICFMIITIELLKSIVISKTPLSASSFLFIPITAAPLLIADTQKERNIKILDLYLNCILAIFADVLAVAVILSFFPRLNDVEFNVAHLLLLAPAFIFIVVNFTKFIKNK